MKINDLKKKIFQFIEANIDLEKPLLLGVSGGVDSIALLHILLEHPRLRLAVAHVDHGFRTESQEEALQLKELSDHLKLPFHSLRLDPKQLKGNLEDAWRKERYRFFKNLCDTYGYQAVALGHHADDQVETVLKRVLEGAHLTSFSGILPTTSIYGVKVLRPLIDINKGTLVEYVESLEFIPFHDTSNDDTKFLRARMRLKIIPMLQQLFGKNISSPLKRLSDESVKLKSYLDERTASNLSSVVEGPFGILLDLSQQIIPHRFELEHLLRRFCSLRNIILSRTQVASVCDLIERKAANRRIEGGQFALYIDRGRLYIVPPLQNKPSVHSTQLTTGVYEFLDWTVNVEKICMHNPTKQRSSWLEAWKGALVIQLPPGKYSIGIASPNQSYIRTSEIGTWWCDHKVPAFMRTIVPVIYNDETIVHEFLTEKSESMMASLKEGLLISITYSKK